MFSKRKRTAVGALTLATAVAVVLAGCSGSGPASSGTGSKQGGQVVFANYGGPVYDAFKTAYLDPFTEKTGVKVVSANADPARFNAMAKSGSSQWDTLDSDGFNDVYLYNEKLIQKRTGTIVKNDSVPAKYQDYVGGGYSQSFVLAYSKKDFPNGGPTSWADYWNTSKFPGKRGIANYYIGLAEAALTADGVAADKVYPLDLNRAFKKWDELKGDLSVAASYSAATQELQAGTVAMSILPSGRAEQLAASDSDIDVEWNQNIYYPWNGFPIPNGAPNVAGMSELINLMNDPKRQAVFAEKSFYGPTMKSAFQYIPADVQERLPGTDEHVKEAVPIDTEVLAGQTDAYIKAFTAWVSK